MRWIGWLFHPRNRRLEVSTGGKWFLFFTVVLGVVAINSGNNVVYLLESLLLSTLIFSGILSEFTVSRLSLHRYPRQAVAGEPTSDLLVLKNNSWLPLYCVEIGEWRAEKFHPLQFVLIISAGREAKVLAEQVLAERGWHDWAGLAIATSFPFGFARKVRMILEPGRRIVWPAREAQVNRLQTALRGEWEPSEGELEEVSPFEDLSRVHWPSSARSEALLARPRRKVSELDVVTISLQCEPGEREFRIRGASARLQAGARTLLFEEKGQWNRVEGAWPALDTLAVLPKSGGVG